MKKNKKQPQKTIPPKEETLTKEGFLKILDKVILTVKKPKSPAKAKKGTSE